MRAFKTLNKTYNGNNIVWAWKASLTEENWTSYQYAINTVSVENIGVRNTIFKYKNDHSYLR